jgi:hypoxanthine phosphoribosyltransferase
MNRPRPDAVPKVLISEAQVRERVDELAIRISRDHAGEEIMLVGVLKGAFIFMADLARRLTIPRRIEFIALSSYGDGSVSGAVRLLMDVRQPLEGMHVVVVEDIVDTGRTLRYLMELLRARGAASVRTCALVRKVGRDTSDVAVDYLGFEIPDAWVVGYGLDYAEQHRTLPYIGVLEVEQAGGPVDGDR